VNVQDVFEIWLKSKTREPFKKWLEKQRLTFVSLPILVIELDKKIDIIKTNGE
jgi:hypothetical protein